MLKFLKKIFEKEKEIKNIEFKELLNYLDEKETHAAEKQDHSIEEYKIKIDEEIKKTEDNLEKLKNAQLKNPKIPPQAINAMSGNRESYINRTYIFLEDIKKEDIVMLIDSFDEKLHSFAKSTAKNYQVLQEFFGDESGAVASNIKNIEDMLKDLKNRIGLHNLDLIKSIKQEYKGIENKKSIKKELEDDLRLKEKSIEKIKKDIENKHRELDELKKSEEYLKYGELLKKKSSIEEDIKQHHYSLLSSFSILEKSLKKYEKIAFENHEWVRDYASNPIQTLIRDDNLEILKILPSLENNIEKMDLKDKKKDKTISEIKRLDKEFLEEYKKKNKELEDKKQEIEKEISLNESIEKEDMIKEEIDNLDEKEKMLNREIEDLKKDISNISIEKIKQHIEQELNKIEKIKII